MARGKDSAVLFQFFLHLLDSSKTLVSRLSFLKLLPHSRYLKVLPPQYDTTEDQTSST